MSQRIRIAGSLVIAASIALPATAKATETITLPGGLSSASIWLQGKTGAAARPSPARISAEMSRAGKRKELTWWVLRRPGQRVTFEERGTTGSRVLGFTTGGTGSLRFRPAKGAGLHRIIARVQLNGVTTEELTVARFRVRRLKTR